MQGCLRLGYLFAVFSFLAMVVAFFLYGRSVALPDQPIVALIYRAGFVFATPLVTALGIDSLFVHLMLAGLFQILLSFGIGFSIGLLLRAVRHAF